MLKRVSLSLLFLYLYACAAAQDSTQQQQDSIPRKHYIRSVVWTAPVSKITTINGVALSLMTNVESYKDTLIVQGLNVAGLYNGTITGKGVQIGLINMAKGGRIVQIGLINRIGKRIIPFFNCSLKKKKVPPVVAATN